MSLAIYELKLILASGSPRRAQILKDAGFTFDVMVSDVDESFEPNLLPSEIVCELAERKAEAVLQKLDNKSSIIIAADSVVVYQNEILEKPKDKTDAERMLHLLSETTHQVYTGVCIKGLDKSHCFHECSDVYTFPISEDEISHYIETYAPFDKAGAYGIQEWYGLNKVKKIDGSHFNIMGLPMAKLYEALRYFL